MLIVFLLPTRVAFLAAVQSLVKSQEALVQAQASRATPTSDPLASMTAGGDTVGGTSLPGARGATAFELYRRDLLQHPESYS